MVLRGIISTIGKYYCVSVTKSTLICYFRMVGEDSGLSGEVGLMELDPTARPMLRIVATAMTPTTANSR